MAIGIGRRQFVGALSGAAVAWPFVASTQQVAMPVIGYLSGGSPNVFTELVTAFHQGLNETGYIEHRNIGVEYRWALGELDQLSALAADLVHRQVAVIFASGPPAALAAKAATSTIPIVFGIGTDPVKLGLISSLNRPGGNITGVCFFINALAAKDLGLLHELVPQAAVIALLVNPNNADTQSTDAQEAAHALGLELLVLNASTETDIDTAFTDLIQSRAGALLVAASTFFTTHLAQVLALAARHRVPTFYANRFSVEAGGLIGYGPSLSDANREAGIYAGRILKGEKPANMPVMQSTKFELAINLTTAKALGLTVPPSLLAIADKVIE
jgi:putative tryptophan/tyrosine transport system substrate-binding protein